MVVAAILLRCLPLHWLPLATVRSPQSALAWPFVLVLLVYGVVVLAGAALHGRLRWLPARRLLGLPGVRGLQPLRSWLWRRHRRRVPAAFALELFLLELEIGRSRGLHAECAAVIGHVSF